MDPIRITFDTFTKDDSSITYTSGTIQSRFLEINGNHTSIAIDILKDLLVDETITNIHISK